jgi:hypothetical protein
MKKGKQGRGDSEIFFGKLVKGLEREVNCSGRGGGVYIISHR